MILSYSINDILFIHGIDWGMMVDDSISMVLVEISQDTDEVQFLTDSLHIISAINAFFD